MADTKKRNYVGKVTRHTEKAGVTLRARVTSPSGNLTIYRDFKCMVKPLGLTDEQAVIADLNYVSNRLIGNGVTGIKNNITTYMPGTGPNDTNISYTVTGTNIGDYFNSDGVVTKRPSYGEPAVVGTLTVIVKKNEAEASREITVSIDPYTIDEVKDSITTSISWDTIRGQNWAEAGDDATNGMSNVMYPLKLIKNVSSPLMKGDIDVVWEIESDLLESVMDGNPRIDVSTGTIYRPDYVDMFNAKNEMYTLRNLINGCNSKIDSNLSKTFMRLGGLVLKARFSINDTVNSIVIDETVSFSLKTLSMPVKNSDVTKWLTERINQFSIIDTRYNHAFAANTQNDGESSSKEIYIDTSSEGNNASTLKLYTKNDITESTRNNEFTNEYAGIRIDNITWAIILPESMNEGKTPTALEGAAQSVYSRVGLNKTSSSTDASVSVTLDPVTVPKDMRFVLRATMSFSTYEEAISYVTVFYWFTLTDATPKDEPVPPSSGEDGTDPGDASGGEDGSGTTE